MYEITRDGFVFLCMGFTGSAAAQWKEKYIAAFNQMEAQLAGSVTSTNLEAHMATLAQGMHTLLKQNQMTHKYISLLEVNQKGKRRIKPEDREMIMQLREEGMSQSDIARLLRISVTAVNQIIHGKYPFGKTENAACIGIGEVLEKMLDEEEAQLKTLLIGQGDSHE